MLPHLPQVGAEKAQTVGQAVFSGGFFRQGHGGGLDVQAGDVQIRLALQQQQPQKPGAAAQVADPQPGR